MSGGRAAKRRQLIELWGNRYPQPIAELIAVVAQPFDDDDTKLTHASVKAQKDARREVRGLFAPDQAPPSGGEIEAPLCAIAYRLLDVLRADPVASLPVERLASVLAALSDVTAERRRAMTEELVVPEAAQRLDGVVPFAMWR